MRARWRGPRSRGACGLGRGGRWINCPLHFGNLGGREPADLRVAANDRLIFREVHAEGLVVGHIGLDPLDIGSQLRERRIRSLGSFAQLFALEGSDLGDVSLDDLLAHVPISEETMP